MVREISTMELADRLSAGAVRVFDVRGQAEWEEGHIPGVANIPLGYLLDRLDAVPADEPVALHCQGGGRSAIAASLLKARGYDNVMNVRGGLGTWRASGLPVEGRGGTQAA